VKADLRRTLGDCRRMSTNASNRRLRSDIIEQIPTVGTLLP
jgi:hypothetical protein